MGVTRRRILYLKWPIINKINLLKNIIVVTERLQNELVINKTLV